MSIMVFTVLKWYESEWPPVRNIPKAIFHLPGFQIRIPHLYGWGGIDSFPLLYCLRDKVIAASFKQSEVSVTYTVFDLYTVNCSKKKGSACSPPPHETLFSLIENLIVESETKDILRCLIALPDTALQDRGFVELAVMMPYRADRVDVVCRFYIYSPLEESSES